MTSRGRSWAAGAIALAVSGVVVNLARPLAPSLTGSTFAQERFTEATVAAVHAYRQPRLVAALVALVISVAVPVALVGLRGPRQWMITVAERLARGDDAGRRPLVGAIVAMVVVLATRLIIVPLSYWVGHVREVAWGFRTAGADVWVRDWLIGVATEMVVAAVGGAIFVVLWRRWPGDWHWRVVVLGTGLSAVLVMLHPLLVQPLTLTTTPLPAGELRDELATVLEASGLPPDVEVGDASRRTTKVNAFVTGLGPTRRVVLWDTLLALPTEEVVAVVAHEVAHREHRDLPRGVLLGAAGLLPFAVALRRMIARPALLEDVAQPATRALLLMIAAASVAQAVALPPAMWVSRRAEAAADHRAVTLTGDPAPFVDVFRGFVERDLSWPDPPGIAVVLFGSHPSPDFRIRAVIGQAVRDGLPLPPAPVAQTPPS